VSKGVYWSTVKVTLIGESYTVVGKDVIHKVFKQHGTMLWKLHQTSRNILSRAITYIIWRTIVCCVHASASAAVVTMQNFLWSHSW